MVISPKMKKLMFDYSIKCGESLISVQQNIKYLGLNIDDKLKGIIFSFRRNWVPDLNSAVLSC